MRKGSKHSPETLAKMHIAKLGHATSPETRAKIGAKHKGKEISQEHRDAVSRAHKGRVMDEAWRAKLSAVRRGKSIAPWSEERRLAASKARTKHGFTHNRSGAYRTWLAMRQRCFDPNLPGYVNYGGRGITICERWSSFANFLEDMGERPLGKSIDRINVDGNYEPGNCRWATPVEQANNKRPRQ